MMSAEKKILKTLGLLLFCLSSFSCGNSNKSTTSGSGTINFSYQLTENNCATGFHSFNSLSLMCSGLQNGSLNNYCAINLRMDYFNSQCPNQTFRSY